MTWTTRNTVVTILAVICILVPTILAALQAANVLHGAWVTPVEAALGGMLVGLVTPGSPIGRLLDLVWPPTTGASVPMPAEVHKAVETLQTAARAMPFSVPPVVQYESDEKEGPQ